MNNLGRNLFIWALVALIVIVLFSQFQHSSTATSPDKVDFSTFLDEVNAGNVQKVTIRGDEIQGTYREGKVQFSSQYQEGAYPGLVDALRQKQVEVRFEQPETSNFWAIVMNWFPCCCCSRWPTGAR